MLYWKNTKLGYCQFLIFFFTCALYKMFLLLLPIGPRWLIPRMYCSHIGLLYYP